MLTAWKFSRFQEEKTGRLSSLRHIIDLNGYEINPFTMIFATNGTLTYFSQLLHFDNYPELVSLKVFYMDFLDIVPESLICL